MTATLLAIFQVVLAFFAFGVLLLPFGYGVASFLDIALFRQRSTCEQVLWSLALSLPLVLLLSELLGRVLNPSRVPAVLLVLAIIGAGRFVWTLFRSRLRPPSGWRTAVVLASAVTVYTFLATLMVHTENRDFAPTVITDWSVRLPMVVVSATHAVPPPNPLSALGPHTASLRYYYFWYVLCAQPVRLLHLPAMAALAASAGWSALAIVTAALLALRYLAGERGFPSSRIGWLALSFTVIGLDALRATPGLLRRHPNVLPDIEWWRGDRTPGFLTSLLFSPHHTAALACLITAMLLLVEASGELQLYPPARHSPVQTGLRTVLVGAIFAACAGTSTFLTFIFITVCIIWGLDLMRRRRLVGLAVLCGSGVVAWLLSRPYLRELKSNHSAAQGFCILTERSSSSAIGFFAAHHLLQRDPLVALAARQLYVLVFTLLELGFFSFVLWDRFRRELWPSLRSDSPALGSGQRALWILLVAGGLNGMFLSSRLTQAENDLGMHAGMLVRFVLIVWSVPFLERVFSRSEGTIRPTRTSQWLCRATLAVGVLGTVENVLLERFYLPLWEAHVVSGPEVELVQGELSYRLFNIQTAMQWTDRLPADWRIEFNPGGVLQPAYSFFSRRQMVASDLGCGTAFGGDPTPCAHVLGNLRNLYGGFPGEERALRWNHLASPARPALAAGYRGFQAFCAQEGSPLLFADETDPAWADQQSWIWTQSTIYANPTVRIVRCP